MFVKAIDRMRTSRANQNSKQRYLAMYSSIFGGITTDPAAMVIPMDDHMVHRGHGVFDTAAIMDGLAILAKIHKLLSLISVKENCFYDEL